jgi:hypothetical protein
MHKELYQSRTHLSIEGLEIGYLRDPVAKPGPGWYWQKA